MKYKRVYSEYANGTRQLDKYIAENGKEIICEYESGGIAMKNKPDWYLVEKNGKMTPYDTLREAKQVLETGKSDLDLFVY